MTNDPMFNATLLALDTLFPITPAATPKAPDGNCTVEGSSHTAAAGLQRPPTLSEDAGEARMISKNGDVSMENPVLVTTAHRGVFFGYAQNYDGGKTIALLKARNCLRWSDSVRGFLGLAVTGPSKKCQVGPSADIQLQDVTSVAACTAESVAAWEAAPWSR